jgi:prolycopene isomerase
VRVPTAEGAFYCKGSFQKLARALANAVERDGGEVLMRSPVRRILVESGRAAGVVLENGQRIAAPVVISNADLRQTVEELVGAESFPARFRRPLARLTPSVSAFVTYLATDLDLATLGASHETFVYPGFDHEAAFEATLAGRPGWWTATVPTLADPTLAPAGTHLMTLTTLLPYGAQRDWRAEKSARVDARSRAAAPPPARSVRSRAAPRPWRYAEQRRRDLRRRASARPDRPTAHDETPPGLWLADTGPGGGVGSVTSGVNAARGFSAWRATRAVRDSSGGVTDWFDGARFGMFVHWDHARGVEISWPIVGGQAAARRRPRWRRGRTQARRRSL